MTAQAWMALMNFDCRLEDLLDEFSGLSNSDDKLGNEEVS